MHSSAASGTGSPNSASIEFEISATSSVAQCATVDFDLECRAEHCRVDDYYITCRRLKCQRVVQFLLVCLDNERCYLKFCCQLSTVSVLSDLPYKLIRGKELF